MQALTIQKVFSWSGEADVTMRELSDFSRYEEMEGLES